MEPECFLDPNFDVVGTEMDWEDHPRVYLTRDRKLLKIERGPKYVTYHLPETFKSVRFETLAAAYHAAYGKEMSELVSAP